MKRFLAAAAVLIAVMTVAVGASQTHPAGTQEPVRFYVTGFVKSPGAFAHQSGMTVQQGIALAGGLNERGSARGVKIFRVVEGQKTEVDVTLSAAVQPNDVIHVRERLQ
jgi:protein involved in polysaccharide export with SLBB domain